MYDLSSSERLYREGRRFMDAGAWEQAIQRFTASVEAAPHFKTLELLGECFLELGRPKDAVVPLAAAARLNPQPRAPSLLALALARAGRAEDARTIAEEVLADHPGNRLARRVLDGPDP
jgi:tetratricopeptide (TPR) repeat protein